MKSLTVAAMIRLLRAVSRSVPAYRVSTGTAEDANDGPRMGQGICRYHENPHSWGDVWRADRFHVAQPGGVARRGSADQKPVDRHLVEQPARLEEGGGEVGVVNGIGEVL